MTKRIRLDYHEFHSFDQALRAANEYARHSNLVCVKAEQMPLDEYLANNSTEERAEAYSTICSMASYGLRITKALTELAEKIEKAYPEMFTDPEAALEKEERKKLTKVIEYGSDDLELTIY